MTAKCATRASSRRLTLTGRRLQQRRACSRSASSTPCLPSSEAALILSKVNERVKIVNDIRPAGEHHWLILPREHIRDVEQLQAKDLDLCELHNNSLMFMKRPINKRVSVVLEMRSVRDELLRRHCSATDRVHCGYHRARERMLGPIHTIDRISVPHLHLHVIARPHEDTIPDKYSHWFVWTSEEEVFERVEKMAKASMERIDVSLGRGEHSDATSAKDCTSSNLDKT
ncbi:hypothetical protein M440DRAFT_1098049 [Trichoderma longibrachiatum ATCC 18648]|uniref:HIT domain-containing protein n=1 Tax=Trichoderma longibrachiatum ATCC 18648 TaxID=983965 RepID=A0A2T4BRZ9_TRILO|nr:hypothetical protein M440DRAFT_1098049 [Trichoderma longibrachiatum ATCC 18648]